MLRQNTSQYAKAPNVNSLLELEKDFTESKDRELRDREVKIKREIEKLYLNQLLYLLMLWISSNKKK